MDYHTHNHKNEDSNKIKKKVSKLRYNEDKDWWYNKFSNKIKRYDLLRKKTFKQIQKFKWKDYVIEHKKVFLKNIN